MKPLVVGERGCRERLSAAPASDEVQQAVDAAKALAESAGPRAGGVLVEEIDHTSIDPVVGERELGDEAVEPVLRDVGERQRGPLIREAPRDRRPEAAGGACDRVDAVIEPAAHPAAPARVSTSSTFGLSCT